MKQFLNPTYIVLFDLNLSIFNFLTLTYEITVSHLKKDKFHKDKFLWNLSFFIIIPFVNLAINFTNDNNYNFTTKYLEVYGDYKFYMCE